MARTTKTKEEKVDLTGVKEELKGYVDISVKKAIKDELEKSNKRLIREKNKKILFRNIIILILIAIIGFLLFLMFKNKFFNKFLGCENTTSSNIKTIEVIDDKKENEVTLDDLVREFSYLLDNVVIHEESTYINDFYSGNLTNELKNYLSFNNIDISTLGVEEDYNLFDSSLLKYEYNKLFDTNYEGVSFNYLTDKVRYVDKMDSYITDKVLKRVTSNIKREIIDISVDGDRTVFTCIEGIVKDNKLYNVLNNKEINYNGGYLKDYESSLTKVVYTFYNGKLGSIK